MFPDRDISISGRPIPLTEDPIFGLPKATLVSLEDGSTGTAVYAIFDGVYDGTVTYDRFGHLVKYHQGDFGDAQTFDDILHPDGSETHRSMDLFGPIVETTIAADGSKAVSRQEFDPDSGYTDPVVTVTPTRTLVDTKSYTTAAGAATVQTFDNGSRIVSSVNFADHTGRILSYDADGVIDHEKRIGAAGNVVYEVTGAVTGEHSVVQKLADGLHTSLYEGSTFVFKDVVKNDGTVESYSLAAGQSHGSLPGNDTFNGFVGGSDNFVFGAEFGNDTIRKFEAASDHITFLDPAVSPSDISIGYAGYGRDTVLTVADEGTITLKGVHIATLADLHIQSANVGFDLLV